MTTAMPGYRIKIERAEHHVRELAAERQEAFIAREPYFFFFFFFFFFKKKIFIKVNECVPAEWSAIVGDAIHNIRASLDLLMVAVVRRCDPGRQSYNHVHFVIRETGAETQASLPKNIKGASAEAQRLVEELKPYKGGNEAFWRFHQLDVLDKHKAIAPVGAAHRSVGVTFNTERKLAEMLAEKGIKVNPAPMPPVFLRPADRQFPLHDGAERFRAPLNQDLPFEEDPQFKVEIAFGEERARLLTVSLLSQRSRNSASSSRASSTSSRGASSVDDFPTVTGAIRAPNSFKTVFFAGLPPATQHFDLVASRA